MKKIFFAVLLMAAFSCASFSREIVAAGKTYSALGDYKIELADNPLIINGEKIKSFMISYQNSPVEVMVAIKKDKKCKKYLVLSKYLSVQYVCNGKYFGIEKLDKSNEIKGFATSETDLNTTEYYHQKVLASGKGGEVENTQLIAAYFPMLLKETKDTSETR
jgi:hypothetical protein